MALTNNLKKQVDLPVWEWLKQAPTAAITNSPCTAIAQNGLGRYIYYQYPTVFYRYDTWADTWMSLIPPSYYNTGTVAAMRLASSQGNRGRILEAVSTTQFRIPYIAGGNALEGVDIRITHGPGSNEVRKIISVSEPIAHDGGYVTSSATGVINDTTKKWKVNQWVGYTCRVLTGANQVQQRTILYNSETQLVFIDVNLQQYEPWDNQGFLNSASTTYEITSQIITVNSAFNVQPNIYSRFLVKTGVIWLLSSQSSAPFYTFQMYDIITNTWYQKTMNGGLYPGQLGTDVALECFDETLGAVVTGTATAGTNRTITDSSKSMTVDRYRNYEIRIVAGTGTGQRRRIVANKANYFEVDSKWNTTPDATSQYEVYPDTNLVYVVGNGTCQTFAYHIEADMWIMGPYYDYGVLGNTIVKKDGDIGFGIASGTRGTTGVTSIAVSAGGSGYVVGDVLSISTGTNAQCYVTATDTAGAVTAVELRRCGTGYTTGVKATTGGTGASCTINVLTIGTIGSIVTTLSHLFKTGDIVTVSGATEAAWNTTYTIKGVYSVTSFDVEITATANLAATSATSTTLLVDANENWDVNEHVGKYVLTVAGGSIQPTVHVRRITSNTANTITMPAASSFTPTSGTTRYIIMDPAVYGRDTKFRPDAEYPFGYATSGTTTTIVDTSKNWIRGNWVGHVVRIVAGTGLGNELTITANNNNTLVFATATFTPDVTTRYEIMDSYGTATSGSTTTIVDTTKNWVTNQWAGKRVRIIGGTNNTLELAITSNTNNTLTFAAQTTAMDNTSNYVIYGIPARGAGICLRWTYGNDNDQFLWSNIGGSTAIFQRMNLNNQTYDYGFMVSGLLQETFSTGSSFAYDGKDNILIQQNSVGRVFALDVKKRQFNAGGTIPYTMSTAYVGNRMEIVRTEDDLLYLYLMRNNGSEYWRVLVFWT